MKTPAYLALCLAGGTLLAAGSSDAKNLTETNVEKAAEIIDAAIETYGGAERLAGLETLLVEHETITSAVGQSVKPEPPWDRNKGSGMDAIGLEQEIFVVAGSGQGGGGQFDFGTVINGEGSYQIDHLAGTATPIPEPDFNTQSGPFVRVTPALLVKQLQGRAHTAHYLGKAKHNGRKHEVVGFAMEVGPAISLYFDSKTGLLTHSERVLPNFGLVEYEFSDYETIDGIPFNRKFQLRVTGEDNMDRTNRRIVVNGPIDSYTTVSSDLTQLPAPEPDTLAARKLAEGVHLIGGSGTYGLFVEMDDHIVAVGGTGGAEARIAELRKVSDKPIKYGVLTHHHSDHVIAVSEYAKHGAIVIAAQAHQKVVAEAVDERDDLVVETVTANRVLSDGKRQIEIIDIGPTEHTEHLLVTWLPKEKILFSADHFTMPRSGPIGPAQARTRSFAAALAKREIEPLQLVSAHSPKSGTMADLARSLAKQPRKAVATVD